jgi:thiol-disulfide isomerase/thioredoxin
MAKKSYGKKKDNFLVNVIVGFGAVMVLMVVAVLILNANGPKTEYSDFEQIGDYSTIASKSEDAYFVYFYSESCGACTSIKASMMSFANSNNLNTKVYLMDAYSTTGDRSFIKGPGDVAMNSTPTLLLFENGTLTEFIVNADNISDFLESVEDGTYTLD